VSATLFDLRQIAPQPWKNGAGLTREIASAPAADGGGFDWRFSVAEVTREAPFSVFPGIERCIVLLQGHGLRLHGAAGLDHRLDEPLAPFHFPGDLALTGSPIDGPSSDFNVMTRRGAWRAELAVLRQPTTLPAAEVCLLLCCAGRWSTGAGAATVLSPQQGWLLQAADAGAAPAWALAPLPDLPSPQLLVACLHRAGSGAPRQGPGPGSAP
jgi:uncharacterized protein